MVWLDAESHITHVQFETNLIFVKLFSLHTKYPHETPTKQNTSKNELVNWNLSLYSKQDEELFIRFHSHTQNSAWSRRNCYCCCCWKKKPSIIRIRSSANSFRWFSRVYQHSFKTQLQSQTHSISKIDFFHSLFPIAKSISS